MSAAKFLAATSFVIDVALLIVVAANRVSLNCFIKSVSLLLPLTL